MQKVQGAEIRRRQAANEEEGFSSPSLHAAPHPYAAQKQSRAGGRAGSSFLSRNLPAILVAQLFLLAFLVLDPYGFRRPHVILDTNPILTEANKPLLNLADVEKLSERVAINGTVILLICPSGYADFLQNWLLVTESHTRLDGRFLVLAEDEDTYTLLNATYPSNAVLRMDVKDPALDLSACATPNRITLKSLLAAHRKVVYTREIMNTGKNVLMCDVTAGLRRNPLGYMTGHDVYVTLGDMKEKGGEQLLGDFPSKSILTLEAPLPRGVGKLPPLSDEILFLHNNVGAWVILDYWAVVIEAVLQKECNSERHGQQGVDSYTNGASTATFMQAVHNAVHLSPPPRVGLIPPSQFPPPTVFFEDASWRRLIEQEVVGIRTKGGAETRRDMKDRLRKTGLWKGA